MIRGEIWTVVTSTAYGTGLPRPHAASCSLSANTPRPIGQKSKVLQPHMK
jgi:hypothetical protein